MRDEATGRGIPLVELRTTNEVRYYTDSNGIAAIDDPDLLGHKIYFSLKSPGYSYPKDNFGYRGIALDMTAGGSAVVKMKREQIAERLYRLTGSGVYRDSVLVGEPVPIRQPLIDGLVMGQDTVEVTPYNGKIYWFFGDTSRPSYPLGQFGTSGATSPMPDAPGGLDPAKGVDLTYWTDSEGFSRKMIPLPSVKGPVWVGGLFTMEDGGRTRLFTHFDEVNGSMAPTRSGLAVFDDEKAVFTPVCTYPLDQPLHPEGMPFRVRANGTEYLYFETVQQSAFPFVRCVPDLSHIRDPAAYESFTCLAPGTVYHRGEAKLDRDSAGHIVWGWKKDTGTISEKQAQELVKQGAMHADEMPAQLRDIETDAPVQTHGGSVYWNPYRNRWIMIFTQQEGTPSFLGELWFAEADTPVGPWLYARKIAIHGGYTFYNPTQHPFFDQDGGKTIYFEGTYTHTFSDVKDVTPRYDYNQLMYRLHLDDPRLALPAPVYETQGGRAHYAMREGIEAGKAWGNIASIPFYAVPPAYTHDGLVPVYANGAGLTLAASGGASPLFYALPADGGGKNAATTALLYEYRDSNDTIHYATEGRDAPGQRAPTPLCRVWRNPVSVIAVDRDAQPLPSPK